MKQNSSEADTTPSGGKLKDKTERQKARGGRIKKAFCLEGEDGT
jgi:hypothetical protein